MAFQERYVGNIVGVNTTFPVNGNSIGGFLCKTAGTISVASSNGTLVVDAHPVTAGTYYPLPILLNGHLGTFTTAGGASGTLLV